MPLVGRRRGDIVVARCGSNRSASQATSRDLSYDELAELAGEIRDFIVAAVAENAGHLGSNLGVVELTLALHRVFDSPHDALLWDTGHQAYVHKLVTGRQAGFADLRQAGGLSGYPSRAESPHDFVENSHASTILSYAYGLAVARDLGTADHRHVVAVIGDGSMTGGHGVRGAEQPRPLAASGSSSCSTTTGAATRRRSPT